MRYQNYFGTNDLRSSSIILLWITLFIICRKGRQLSKLAFFSGLRNACKCWNNLSIAFKFWLITFAGTNWSSLAAASAMTPFWLVEELDIVAWALLSLLLCFVRSCIFGYCDLLSERTFWRDWWHTTSVVVWFLKFACGSGSQFKICQLGSIGATLLRFITQKS